VDNFVLAVSARIEVSEKTQNWLEMGEARSAMDVLIYLSYTHLASTEKRRKGESNGMIINVCKGR
jgi:hypothetical protein